MKVTSFGTPVTRATVSIRYAGHALVLATDSHGRARVSTKLPRGNLTISVSFPGSAPVRTTLRVQ